MLPAFTSDNPVLDRAFRIALGDLMGNVQPFRDGLLATEAPVILAGLEYDTPWTRDAAINAWNGASLLLPDVTRATLLSVLDRSGDAIRIGGQYWDAIIWTLGAWHHYLYTGDRALLALAYQATVNSLAWFETTELDRERGLFRGPACYGDGVAAYPDRYAQAGGSSSILDWPRHHPAERASEGYGIPLFALSTNCLYVAAYELVERMAQELGYASDDRWAASAERLRAAIEHAFWDERRGCYRYLVDPWERYDYHEGLGNSLALLLGIADARRSRLVLERQPIALAGIPCVWPPFARYAGLDGTGVGRHSGTVWPHIQAFWAEAAARRRDQPRFSHELLTLARHACRDGQFVEIYHPVSGLPDGGLQEDAGRIRQWKSCERQTWSATGFLRMILLGVIGLRCSPAGMRFEPLLPAGVDYVRLRHLRYRRMSLDITVRRAAYGESRCTINSHAAENFLTTAKRGRQQIVIEI